ncbi:histone deacetylase subunit, putative [Candida dubliniensis CD36]|uniref:Histone deacetylase subunit, putative n=1 Tax=Candida dubliniensis (strain CD36 / ATCC MYA-646 / CBS 7987 / NCPF 3949 / NRRL Y-17841) TaxID=573826 RepID=B9WIK1_CANDC|nr:histone deacetylase subunit, putative [Candida dubliniensis CD36]CAX41066.1 histone deacetylase subunit, putative [Candida dubliniensis CD36]
MSLTSKELNYLIWRYLQESGYDLSAYALDQQSQCSEYENNPTTQELIQKIKPGCLVNLIQKGILYMVAEQEATDSANLSLYGALIQDDLKNLQDNNSSNGSNGTRFALKSEIEANGKIKDPAETPNDDVTQDIEMTDDMDQEIHQKSIIEFETKLLLPQLTFAPSLTCDWHPTSEVFAYGKDDGSATINALKDGKIIETRTLTHPNLLNIKNQINIVSWSPQGNLLITCGANSELRAWSPDGKLKNIASTIADEVISLESTTKLTSIISSLSWSPTGKFLLSIDSRNQVCIWDGTTISLIKQIKNLEINDDSVVCFCWLSEDKFAVTTNTNGIKIYDILAPSHFGSQLDVHPIGLLNGHKHDISLMKLNPKTKLLATCSDFDYSIKVWSSSSSQECLDLNINPEKKYTLKLHSAPMIGLIWLPDTNSNERSNLLLSVSMEGALNIWDAQTSESIKSSELFNNKDNFTDEMKDVHDTIKDVLVFNAVLSPDGKYLALGDDYCRVTIWDVDTTHYLDEPKDFVRCKAVYKPELSPEDKLKATIGICDMKWDHESKSICVSYNGMESVIINITT